MSRKIDHGGPAFPNGHMEFWVDSLTGEKTEKGEGSAGMTLRDWFAGQALLAMMSNSRPYGTRFKEQAEDAYAQADAMIDERIKQGIES